ncbi:hypothetical protein GPALN_002161 [Globodera pallida]|nr:hypothetical protein GPALN_002161 [Globodera pallida]
MEPTHPTRLSLALNFSGFNFKILNSFEKATPSRYFILNAFDNATAELDTFDEKTHKDSTLIIQLLRPLTQQVKAAEAAGKVVEPAKSLGKDDSLPVGLIAKMA